MINSQWVYYSLRVLQNELPNMGLFILFTLAKNKGMWEMCGDCA